MSVLILVFAVAGFLTGNLTADQAISAVLASGSVASLRAGFDNALANYEKNNQ